MELSIETSSGFGGSINTVACRIEEGQDWEINILRRLAASNSDDTIRQREELISNLQMGQA